MDFLDPTQGPPTTPEDHQTLKNGWSTFLQNPDTRAALIQFGVSMLAPTGGDFFSNVGQAVGAAGETVSARQDQRTQMANADLNRQLDIAGLRLRADELTRLREQDESQSELARAGQGVDVYNARTSRMNAETAAKNVPRGGLTPDQLIDAKARAIPLYQSAVESFGLGLGPDPGTQEDFMRKYEQAVGIPSGNTTSATTTARETGLDISAAPQGAPQVTTPQQPAVSDGVKLTASQLMVNNPERFARLKAALTAPDPATRAAAAEWVNTYISDPQAILGAQ